MEGETNIRNVVAGGRWGRNIIAKGGQLYTQYKAQRQEGGQYRAAECIGILTCVSLLAGAAVHLQLPAAWQLCACSAAEVWGASRVQAHRLGGEYGPAKVMRQDQISRQGELISSCKGTPSSREESHAVRHQTWSSDAGGSAHTALHSRFQVTRNWRTPAAELRQPCHPFAPAAGWRAGGRAVRASICRSRWIRPPSSCMGMA